MSKCTINQISIDCLDLIFYNFTSVELSGVTVVCKLWKYVSNESLAWKFHCAHLWASKQNHLLERWVQITPVQPRYVFCSEILSRNRDTQLDLEMQDVENALDYDMLDIIPSFTTDRVQQVYDDIKHQISNVQETSSFESASLLQRLEHTSKLLQRTRTLGRLAATRGDELLNGRTLTARCAAPLSQAVRMIWIGDEALLEASNCIGTIPLELVKLYQNRMSSAMHVGVSDDTQTPIWTKYEKMAKSAGVLLTWRESYIASLKDSRRRHITYEVWVRVRN